ncbi:MAG TPA: glutamate-5-semialdehyde dehydrogenase [Bacteriovoracaceae bacterium]|nr:glutamate-5-semialdehyde dehydrogenase [Bacteriovoracaceae bacterium]
MIVIETARLAKKAMGELLSLSEDQRTAALQSISRALLAHSSEILKENAKDLAAAMSSQLSVSLIDRLTLDQKALEGLSLMCLQVSKQPQVVGLIVEEYTRPNGLLIQKQRIPLGVIGMVFESRPNVIADGAALAIKSGNAIILKGGKEAIHSNKILFETISRAVEGILPAGSLSMIETRSDVDELLKLHEYIDLMVPRGGSSLIKYVKEHATMPVVAHDKGLCHLFVNDDALVENVIPVVLNAKTQRPGVCNALETLLIHQDYPQKEKLLTALLEKNVEVRGCATAQKINPRIRPATEKDYFNEYLDQIISLKIVGSLDEAISHIKAHTSHHTEAILTQDSKAMEKFLNSLDASALIINASTRFNDGGELGLGAELGISTSKLHAYGPMGAKEMTTTRFLVTGTGQIR